MGYLRPQQRDNCSDPRVADDLCLAGFEEFYYDFNNNGQFDLNDTPQASANSSLPDGLYNGVLCRSEDEASGVCSRNLVQLSQNLEIILSPGEQGYDFLVVDRNQARGQQHAVRRQHLPALRRRPLQQPSSGSDQHYHHGRGWVLGHQCGHHGAVAQ